MKTLKEIAQKLIRKPEIIENLKKISNLKVSIKNMKTTYPQLNWTNYQYRFYLEDKILAQNNIANLPLELQREIKDNLEIKIDLIVPPSIIKYRYDSLKDIDLFMNTSAKQNQYFGIDQTKLFLSKSHLGFLKQYREKVKLNKSILASQPLTSAEIKDLEKRIIYAISGGRDNIKKISLINKEFLCNNKKVKLFFLKINLRDNERFNFFRLYSTLSHFDIVNYNSFFQEQGILLLSQDLSDDIDYEIQKNQYINEQKIKNNFLIAIKSHKSALSDANEFIKNWQKSVNKDLKTIYINKLIDIEWANSNIDQFNTSYHAIISTFLVTQYQLDNFEDELLLMIKENIKNSNIIVNDFNELKTELLNTFNQEKLS